MPCLQHRLALGGDLPKNDLFADRKVLNNLVQRKDEAADCLRDCPSVSLSGVLSVFGAQGLPQSHS